MTTKDAVKRLFAAVPLSDSLKLILRPYMEQMKTHVPFRKWVHPDDLHITLQFLGDTPESKVSAVSQALEQAAAGVTPLTLRIGSPGTFGRPGEPSILWLGVEGELSTLKSLQKQVADQLEPLGFLPEKRAFHPHLTIARSYTGSRPFSAQQLRGLPSPALSPATDARESVGNSLSWHVDELVLYVSHLDRRPMYEPLARIPLLQSAETLT